LATKPSRLAKVFLDSAPAETQGAEQTRRRAGKADEENGGQAPIVVIAALSGGALLGILGALVAIPFAASVIFIVREIFIPRQNKL
jgi:hypothetical protein